MAEYESVIGLEIHCQLSTNSKIFCPSLARLPKGASVGEEKPNTHSCPVCAGHPGTLPVLNKKVVEYAVRAGLALGCKISEKSIFARKNYFYPDLPKGYQISQFADPLCVGGSLTIETSEGETKIGLERIHMEEDAGKSVHERGYSLVNLNRAGVPLIEIVSKPEMRSAEEAGAYMRELYGIVTFLGICDGNLQEGNFRCDANVSVRPKGQKKLGTRAEIKNLNSFRFVEKAIEYEIERQTTLIEGGGEVVQETRLFDSTQGVTLPMRSKEEAHDYRYFPDPDLLPLSLEKNWIESIRKSLPELPPQIRARYQKDLGLSQEVSRILTGSKSMSSFFDNCVDLMGQSAKKPIKTLGNLMTGEVSRLLNESSWSVDQSQLEPQNMVDLVALLAQNSISSTNAKKVVSLLWKRDSSDSKTVEEIVDSEGLKQISDTGALEKVIHNVIRKFPSQVQEYKSGKEKVMGFLVGQAMKLSAGKANPALLKEMMKETISKRPK